MAKQMVLDVQWTENERTTYWVDKDEHSVAHDCGMYLTVSSFGGTYSFNKVTKVVELWDGRNLRFINVVSWAYKGAMDN